MFTVDTTVVDILTGLRASGFASEDRDSAEDGNKHEGAVYDIEIAMEGTGKYMPNFTSNGEH